MDRLAAALAQVALVTSHFGDHENFGAVLQDWIRFLGGKPGQVVVVDGGSSPAAYRVALDLQREGLIDTLDLKPPQDPVDWSLREIAYVNEYKEGVLARKPYVLFFTSDTLPYRQGHEEWLSSALELLQRDDVFAVSGSFNLYCRVREAWSGWYWSDRCSLNFALMRRDLFMASTDEFAGAFIRSDFRGSNPAAATGQARYVIEIAFEKYMARHHMLTLTRHEDPTWTVFHTNTRAARLAQARVDFYARKNLARFIDAGANPRLALPRQARYYGQPDPGLVKRARICFGRTRAGPHWRAFKRRMRVN